MHVEDQRHARTVFVVDRVRQQSLDRGPVGRLPGEQFRAAHRRARGVRGNPAELRGLERVEPGDVHLAGIVGRLPGQGQRPGPGGQRDAADHTRAFRHLADPTPVGRHGNHMTRGPQRLVQKDFLGVGRPPDDRHAPVRRLRQLPRLAGAGVHHVQVAEAEGLGLVPGRGIGDHRTVGRPAGGGLDAGPRHQLDHVVAGCGDDRDVAGEPSGVDAGVGLVRKREPRPVG